MKKKVKLFGALFLLSLLVILGTVLSLNLKVDMKDSAPSFSMSTDENEDRFDALMVSGEITIDVGEEFDFSKKFMPYVTEDEKRSITIEVEDEEILYLTNYKYKVIGLKAGDSKLTLSSSDYFTELTIHVALKNICADGNFSDYTVGTTWTQPNETIKGWRLWVGSASSVDTENQIVEIVDEDGNNVVHYNHKKISQSVLYKTYNVEPGQYFVTARIKGINVSKDTYIRVNQDNKNKTLTDKLVGTFEWTDVKSDVFRIEVGEKPLKLELYTSGNTGEMWFDDIEVYRVIEPDHLSISVESIAEELAVGEEKQIVVHTNPISEVDYNYSYEVADESIAKVSPAGVITAVSSGITTITVTDLNLDYKAEIKVIVGQKDGIHAKVNDDDNLVQVNEDGSIVINVTVSDSTNYEIIKYSNASYGDYYIRNNKIVYSPKRNVFTTNANYDNFQIVVFDSEKGYQIVDIKVDIKPVLDDCYTTEFWLTTPKGTALEWTTTGNKYNYSAGAKYYDSKQDLYYNGGYVQITCNDVEVLYPYTTRPKFQGAGNEYILRKEKADLYHSIYATAADGTMSLTTKNGGKVELFLDGTVQEIQDRYYTNTQKIIHGVLYNYTPKAGFYGYDSFNLTIHNGTKTSVVSTTIYVLPGEEDFKFNELASSGKLDELYMLSNSDWISEIRSGYEANDEYITRWVDYYEKNLAYYKATTIPANGRSAMEQFAILYQVTGKKEYADRSWEQMRYLVQDENFSENPDQTRRLTWGEATNGFLDAAMVTYSVAFAYSYIKDTLNDEQKEMVMKALYEEGFYFFETLQNVNVLLHGNNHCLLICGDLAMAALSTLSYDKDIVATVQGVTETVNVREMSAKVIITAFKFLQNGLVHYSDSGGFPEGPSYSIYAHRNIVSLLATLRNLYGETDGKINSFGLSDIKGIMNYINYPLYSSSPNHETFYYAESEFSNNQPALLWYTRIDESNINAAVLSKLADENEQYNIMNLLWYRPGLFDEIDLHNMDPLDFLLEDHELATFRSAFGDEMAIFTGLKGIDVPSGSFAHRNLDSGTFEIYAYGERFIGNFSDERYTGDYPVPNGFWDYEYQRWTYYKKSAQGQNTLVFNPEKNPVIQQDQYEYAPIIKFETNASGGYSIVDLSRVYKSDAISAYRGLKFFDNRTKIMIQDEFELRDESVVYWSAHTEAKIEIINDKLARLILNGKSLYAYINSEVGTFDVMSGNTPLPGTIGEFCNLDNTGVNKLIIKLENVTSATLNVVFVPSLDEITEFEKYNIVPLDSWSLEVAKPSVDIAVENIEVEAEFGNKYKYVFNPYQYQYIVKLDNTVREVPNLNVTYDNSKYSVTVEKSKSFNQFTKVIVKDLETEETKEYLYRFVVDTIIDGYEDFTQIPVVNVTGNSGVENLLDGERTTTFTSEKREIVIFEFEKNETITNVLMRFSGGLLNTYYFDMYYSLDGENWTTCYFGGQSTNNMGDEVYSLGFIEAKYIKIVFNGNNNDEKTTISKVEFYHNNYQPQTTGGNNNVGIIIGCVCGGLALVAAAVVVTVILMKKRGKRNEETITNDSSTSN
ncbi:MAG: discoidin domain-containing protein [Anaeroplasmataceae bacterium]|nr:discoidin domain-containing protein [Anaeroplasmataceae bacterium]